MPKVQTLLGRELTIARVLGAYLCIIPFSVTPTAATAKLSLSVSLRLPGQFLSLFLCSVPKDSRFSQSEHLTLNKDALHCEGHRHAALSEHLDGRV